ncbi:DUF2607 family protein [uncultured Vibrio sp.]|uniref:DUF2607 family protein n=1 Tax=uncultured Vibrio sp. TaxID=114054 RepID=UPI00091F75FC|nr:DUF2607 family protein [uncultured Vibrio sp.]OIQ24693.1 MAG: hypothetical protein BM561_09070 [Vibrio sp. MedPE-SWchi]
MNQPITITQRLISLSFLIGVLWLNFAYVEHQYLGHNEHHSEHQCQLFSSAGHGLIQKIPEWLNATAPESFTLIYNTGAFAAPFLAYLARSPPNQLIYKH